MHKSVVCPHYGRDEDACDVGCGYISSHDANMIIRYCSSDYRACSKFRELDARMRQEELGSTPAIVPSKAPAPPVLGLFSYGVAASVFALGQVPSLHLNLRVLCALVFIAALCQVISGFSSLKKNPLQGIALSGIGLFWISMLAFNTLPQAGYGFVPGTLPMVGYLAVWGLFSLIISQGIGDLSRICRIVFTLFMAFLMLLALSHAIASPVLLQISALVGVTSALPGLLIGLQYIYREALKDCMPELSNTGKTH